MIGRQMMGRIDSRLRQGKPNTDNPLVTLGGTSTVCVGDPAQCEAIADQQIYDLTPKPTPLEGDVESSVLLSNKGLDIYSEFQDVIILTTVRRLSVIDNPQTEEDRAYNERAQRFITVLHRLRDLDWDIDDYYWLCKRKKKLAVSF